MPINSFLYPGAKVTPAYEVANSCRFDASSSAYMHKTPSSTGVEEKFTFSFWIKFNSAHSANQCVLFIEGDNGADDYVEIAFKPQLDIQFNNGTYSNYVTNRKFRDPSAWYHIVIAVDTTQSTAGNRLKLYVNGTQETSFATETVITQNDVLQANTSGKKMWLNAHYNGPKNFVDGYLAEVVWIDGTQYAASDFGEFDEDSPTIWKPKDVSGLTFGTNGFYLDFEDSSNLGNDANGGTDLTEVNLAATDQSTDTCTNNFATLNPLTIVAGASLTLSEGNLQFNGTSTDAGAKATFGVSSGKWYWEVKTKLSDDNSSGSDRILVATETVRQITSATDPNSQGIWGIQSRSGSGATLNSFTNGTFSNGNSGSTGFNNGTIIGVALDADNGKLYFHKDGTYTDLSGNTGDPANGTNPTFTGLPTDGTFLFPYFENRPNVTPSSQVNFGGTQSFSISSGNSDGNGYGNFEYSVPSGYYALNTKNLAEYG